MAANQRHALLMGRRQQKGTAAFFQLEDDAGEKGTVSDFSKMEQKIRCNAVYFLHLFFVLPVCKGP